MSMITRTRAAMAARLRRAWAGARSAMVGGRSAVHDLAPDFWQNLAAELAGGRLWVDRALALAYACLTGLVVVGFTVLSEASSHAYAAARSATPYSPWLALAWTPLDTELTPGAGCPIDRPSTSTT